MTHNVELRQVRDGDLPIFFEQQLDPAANRMAAFTRGDPADREAFAAHWARIRADRAVRVRTILRDGEVAGHIASFERDGEPEVTYWIGRAYWGRGVATRALAAFLGEVTARPLTARAASDNVASIRVLEKCGFTPAGQERGFAAARGEEIDETILKLE